MIIGTRGTYSRETWFDQNFRLLGRTLRGWQRAYGAWFWPLLFLVFAVALYLTGGVFAYQVARTALTPYAAGTSGGPLAELGGVILAFASARHFAKVSLQAMPAASRSRWNTSVAQDRLAGGLMLLVVAGVLVPMAAAAAFAARPGLGAVFVAALLSMLATTVSLHRLYNRRPQGDAAAAPGRVVTAASVPAGREDSPDQCPVAQGVAPASPGTREFCPQSDDPQWFLGRLREAGLNVRVAKAVYLAGLRSEQHLRAADDAALLAINGVGPATLAKLRNYLAKAA